MIHLFSDFYWHKHIFFASVSSAVMASPLWKGAAPWQLLFLACHWVAARPSGLARVMERTCRLVRAESASVCVLRWSRISRHPCTFSLVSCSAPYCRNWIQHAFFTLISRISVTVSTYSYCHTSCPMSTFKEVSVQFSFAWWTDGFWKLYPRIYDASCTS